MKLIDAIHRQSVPKPWNEEARIPWDSPHISKRLLKEHLSQKHEAASRRFETIDKHVAWIHHHVLSGKPTRILDLCCGPGLYTSRLSKLGNECVGIDFSPAAIAYASNDAEKEKLSCSYLQQDIRTANYGTRYGLGMLIYGEFNVFSRTDARYILEKSNRALEEDGLLLLEARTFSAVREAGAQPPLWYSANGGIVYDKPHICLKESFWHAESSTTTERFFIIDALTGCMERYEESLQAYTEEQYQSLLIECGFRNVEFQLSLSGEVDEAQRHLFVIVAQKQEAV